MTKINRELLNQVLNAHSKFLKQLSVRILNLLRTLPTEDKCLHIKGMGKTSHGFNITPEYKTPFDFSLSYHRFIDGTERIRCLICGKKWFKGQKDWGWAYEKFSKNSTNTKSASEMPMSAFEKRIIQENSTKE